MNAPLRHAEISAPAALHVFAFFHLNLAFSSIEEERRDEVIARCYWPLLRLAERHRLGLEISGHTLEEIAARDPAWIARAKQMIAAGRIELIGSGYSQMIGPLVPERVTVENLRLGAESYEYFLGVRPRLALVNEQAYAGGLVGLYLDAGYDALIMDYDNPAAAHPEWKAGTAFRPGRALGADGRSIALIWSNTAAFQQLQRFAHGDIERDTYLRFVAGRRGTSEGALCLYASDAEIFDFRPGRFRTEEKLPAANEWDRLGKAFTGIDAELVLPSRILTLLPSDSSTPLRLESAACPVPVKKQRKYNLARWAVTGRDNLAINAACERIYRGMVESAEPDRADSDWKELCYLWASDFRTHLTDKRWAAYCARLRQAEARWSTPLPPPPIAPSNEPAPERHIGVRTPSLNAVLDRRRGLAIETLHFTKQARPSLGGLPHGFFDEIELQADWYTGDSVFEAPGEHKLTDLEWCEAHVAQDKNGDMLAFARIETPKGPIEKHLRFCATAPHVEFDLRFHWRDWGKGVLRLGHFTLLPEAFDAAGLTLATNNGGPREIFALAGQSVDHGAPVSFLVSSSHGLGMTEGWAEIGDGATRLRIEVDRGCAPLLGLLTHRQTRKGPFCQLQLSALELDDTRNPSSYREGPRRFRFSVSAI